VWPDPGQHASFIGRASPKTRLFRRTGGRITVNIVTVGKCGAFLDPVFHIGGLACPSAVAPAERRRPPLSQQPAAARCGAAPSDLPFLTLAGAAKWPRCAEDRRGAKKTPSDTSHTLIQLHLRNLRNNLPEFPFISAHSFSFLQS